MEFERSVVLSFAKTINDEVVRSVVASLQTLTDGMQGGGDDGLENIWEELCVQVQGEQSPLFSCYEDIVDSYIARSISGLPANSRLALWLATDAGFDWSCDQVEGEKPSINDQDIIDKLRSLVISEASDFESERIYNHIWRVEGDAEDEQEE
jgi:hypothetical protein